MVYSVKTTDHLIVLKTLVSLKSQVRGNLLQEKKDNQAFHYKASDAFEPFPKAFGNSNKQALFSDKRSFWNRIIEDTKYSISV